MSEQPTIGEVKQRFPTLFGLVEQAGGDMQYQAQLELLVLIEAYSRQAAEEPVAERPNG